MTPGPADSSFAKRVAYVCLQPIAEGQASFAHVWEIVNGLRTRGMSVRLFSSRAKMGDASVARRAAEAARVQARLLRSLATYDAAYVRLHPLTLPVVLLARALGIPAVVEVNGTDADALEAWPAVRRVALLIRWLVFVQLRAASSVIVVTPQLRDWARDRAKVRTVIRVIPNAANTDVFHPTEQDEENVEGPYVVFFGALAPWQGVQTMLEATRSPAWPAALRLVVAGDGVFRPLVEEAASESAKVEYAGVIPYRELPAVVSSALAGLSVQVPIADRGTTGVFPLKLFETLACGRPVIVSDLPAQADFVRAGRCGLVVAPGDAEALAAAVARLALQREEADAMGKRGLTLVRASHSWDSRAEETAAVLRLAMEHRRGSG